MFTEILNVKKERYSLVSVRDQLHSYISSVYLYNSGTSAISSRYVWNLARANPRLFSQKPLLQLLYLSAVSIETVIGFLCLSGSCTFCLIKHGAFTACAVLYRFNDIQLKILCSTLYYYEFVCSNIENNSLILDEVQPLLILHTDFTEKPEAHRNMNIN